MGFLDFLQGSPIKRFEKEAADHPSPDTLAALAQKHLEMGQLDEAQRVVDEALQRFRGARVLSDLQMHVRKKRSAEPIRVLREEIAARPDPGAYAQLAGLHRDLGEIEQAMECLSTCVERFPESEAAYLMLAQIRMESYLREVIAYDGTHALHALRRVLEISPGNSAARLLLAQFYYAVGANALCVEEMRRELENSPTAMDLKDFLSDMGTPPPLPPDLSVEDLIERSEDEGALPNSLSGFPRVSRALVAKTQPPPRINPAAVQSRLHDLGTQAGVLNLAVLDRAGAPVASIQGVGSRPREQFLPLSTEVVRIASDACRRMDIGSFARGTVRAGTGGATFLRQRGLTFAMLYDEPMKHDRAAELLSDLVEKTLGRSAASA